MQHSAELKQTVIRKALSGEMTQEAIAKEFGVGRSTVQNWVRQERSKGARRVAKTEKRPQDWTPEERLAALIETDGLSEQELGQWCRRQGLHTHHLEQWKRDALTGGTRPAATGGQAELRRLREENKRLKKELRRKDKALAETSALLVLKKKANLIWGDGEDD